MTKRVLLGKIITAHGVKGMVKLQVLAENSGLFDGNPLFTRPQGGKPLRVKLKSRAADHWLAAIEGVADRDAAEALRGTELWLDRDRLPEPAAGEYYYTDLIGMQVEDENGRPAGTVIAVANFGAGDLLEIKPEGESSFYLPFTAETILAVEQAGNLIRAAIPEGLRQL